ncbi:translation initiation factor IF-2-like [Teleopsis dalmanni]|uniref:translation initiation factor IF-2-like n=1 Tax=Teleopsis dalmanni TaxID=139649 RepID=UPI0018CCE865|nr:translation initiation factor IF-2-like [Teleopsis dalmanni]
MAENKGNNETKTVSNTPSKAKVTFIKKPAPIKHVDRPTVADKATNVTLSKSEEMPSTSRAAEQRLQKKDVNIDSKLNSILDILNEDIEKREKKESKETALKKKQPIKKPLKPKLPRPKPKTARPVKMKKPKVQHRYPKPTSVGSPRRKLLPNGLSAKKTTLQHRMAFLSTVNNYIFGRQYNVNRYKPNVTTPPLKKSPKASPRSARSQRSPVKKGLIKNVTKAKKGITGPVKKKVIQKVVAKKQNVAKKVLPKKTGGKKPVSKPVVKKNAAKTKPTAKVIKKPIVSKVPAKKTGVMKKILPKNQGKIKGIIAKTFDPLAKDPGAEKRSTIRSSVDLERAEAELKVYQQRIDERKALAMKLEAERSKRRERDFPLIDPETKSVMNEMSEYPPIYNKRKDPNSERKYILL